jgi:succinoglycan biosynthesis protein ExoM
MSMSPEPLISICVCTYRRPSRLQALLGILINQETGGKFTFSIVIVDNDIRESARPIADSQARHSDISIRYDVEPRQNIALARNKAIENSSGDFVALIDDDELPDSRWLLNHFLALMRFNADGVLGPVLPRFEKKPPRWVVEGRFFDRPSHPTGTILDWRNTRTGNVLLRRKLFGEGQEWFDPAFGSGGEDRDFFRRKIAQGHIFVWSNGAPVFEMIPPQRWDVVILIKRALLRGKMSFRSSPSKPSGMVFSMAAILFYSIGFPFLLLSGFVIGYDISIKCLISTFDHLGKLFALFKFHPVRKMYIS